MRWSSSCSSSDTVMKFKFAVTDKKEVRGLMKLGRARTIEMLEALRVSCIGIEGGRLLAGGDGLEGAFLSCCGALNLLVLDGLTRSECDSICKLSSITGGLQEGTGDGALPIDVKVCSLGGRSLVHENKFVGEESHAEHAFLKMNACGSGSGNTCNIICCGRTEHLADELEVKVKRSISVLKNSLLHKKVVLGRGLTELLCARALKKTGETMASEVPTSATAEQEVAGVVCRLGGVLEQVAMKCVAAGMCHGPGPEEGMVEYGRLSRELEALAEKVDLDFREAGWWCDDNKMRELCKIAEVNVWDDWWSKRECFNRAFGMWW